MKTVAEGSALNDAIAQMSDRAWRFLRDVHAGRRHDARAMAASQLRELTELARCTGIELSDVPAYRTNAANWRAIARLAVPQIAGSQITSPETTQAG
jgi:hypothetical protein